MRPLDTLVLTGAATRYAKEFVKDSVVNSVGRFVSGRSFVMEDLQRLTFKDEFQFIINHLEDNLAKDDLKDFRRFAGRKFTPRSDDTFEKLLARKLAINPNGDHIPGLVGTTQVGARVVGRREHKIQKFAPPRVRDVLIGRKHGPLMYEKTVMKNEYWPLYAGELAERIAGSDAVDPLPEGAQPFIEELYANAPGISNSAAIAACDAIVDLLDEGTGDGVIEGRTGAQPVDVDTTVAGTLLFTLIFSAAAFGNAADDTGKATATAAAITPDTDADATGALGYCRASSSNDSITPLNDHMDGEAGLASADYIFNTLDVVSGAEVSMSAMTVSVPEQ